MTNTHEQMARKFVKYVTLTHVCWFGDTIAYPCERRYPNVPNSAKCETTHGPLVAPGSASSIPHVSVENAAILYILTRVRGTNCIKLSVKKRQKRNGKERLRSLQWVKLVWRSLISSFVCPCCFLFELCLSSLRKHQPSFSLRFQRTLFPIAFSLPPQNFAFLK